MNSISKRQNIFICEICEKVLTRKHDLYRHIQSVHQKERPYSCKICGKSFASKSYIKVHHRRLHNQECFLFEDEINVLFPLDENTIYYLGNNKDFWKFFVPKDPDYVLIYAALYGYIDLVNHIFTLKEIKLDLLYQGLAHSTFSGHLEISKIFLNKILNYETNIQKLHKIIVHNAMEGKHIEIIEPLLDVVKHFYYLI